MTSPIPDPLDPAREPTPDNLLDAVNRLSGHVVALTDRLDISVEYAAATRKQAVRTRWLTLSVLGLLLLVTALSGFFFYRLRADVDQSANNAVSACENANDARQANLTLWSFLIDSSERKAPPAKVAELEKIRAYVEILYAPHDCNNLGKTYEIPPPPKLNPNR